MEKIKGLLESDGSMKEFSFYVVRGREIFILKTNGNTYNDQKTKSILSENMCKHQKEFGGCAYFGSLCRTALGGLHLMADMNVTSIIIGKGKNIMKFDTESELGKRKLILSEHKKVLEEVYFNKTITFDTILLVKPVVKFDRENLKAVIIIPEINTNIDLFNTKKHPFFRIMVAMGSVPDIIYNPDSDEYESMVVNFHSACEKYTTEWYPSNSIIFEQTITLQIPESRRTEFTDNINLVLSIAVQFGRYDWIHFPIEKKHGGYGKVLLVF